MDPETVETNKKRLIGSLQHPDNFNSWLQGEHYAYRYKESLELTENACSQAIRLSNLSMAAASKSHHRPPRVKSPPQTESALLLSKSRKQQQKAAEAAAGRRDESGEEESPSRQVKSSKEEERQEGEIEVKELDGEQQAPEHQDQASNPAKPQQQPRRPTTKRTTGSRSGKGGATTDAAGNRVVNGENLDSAGIRNHLRESYYHMKAANAFGNTFPALLTPLNRSLFHVYDEEDLPRRRRGNMHTSPISSNYNSTRPGRPEEEWKDMSGRMLGGRSYDYPYQNEVLNETCLRNMLMQPGGPPAFYPAATRPLRNMGFQGMGSSHQ
eukprot:gene11716-8061_t